MGVIAKVNNEKISTMKKSQLRNIIKESIGELMTEQSVTWDPCPGQPVHQWERCAYPGSITSLANSGWPGGNGYPPPNQGQSWCEDSNNFYQSVGSPSIGQTIRISPKDGANPNISWSYKYLGTASGPCPLSLVGSGNCPGGWAGTVSQWTNTVPQSWGPFPDCATADQSILTSTCDTSPASSCAQQWFGNNASNFANWMASKDCSNYQSIVNSLEQQAWDIMATATNPQQGPYNGWNDIRNAANASGLTGNNKGKFKRKAAKSYYSLCQITACNC